MVINPNESWKDFFKSMIEFREPDLVPIGSLPPEQHPQNRTLGSVKYMVNWRGQNYIETWKPVPNNANFAEVEQDHIEP